MRSAIGTDMCRELRLLWQAREGCRTSLGSLFEAHRPYLIRVASRRLRPQLRSKISPSDLVQETYVKFHDHLDQFRGQTREELLGWLRKILINTLANLTRRHYLLEQAAERREVPLGSSVEVQDSAGMLADPNPLPYDVAMTREEILVARRALDLMPERYRQVLEWRSEDRLSYSEIGRRLGRSHEAARKLWAQSLRVFQRNLKKVERKMVLAATGDRQPHAISRAV